MRTPRLQKHVTGVYFTRWASRTHYFTTNKTQSEQLFASPNSVHPGSLAAWQKWRDLQPPKHGPIAKGASKGPPLTVVRLAYRFLAEYETSRRFAALAYFRNHLRRFLVAFGEMPVHAIDETALEAFRVDLAAMDLSAKTQTHDLKAIKTMWRWGSSVARRLCTPLDLESIKTPRLPRPKPEPIDRKTIVRELARLREGGSFTREGVVVEHEPLPWLADYLAFIYLTACRASECVRCAYGQARLIDLPKDHEGGRVKGAAAVLTEHKTAGKTQEERYIPLTPEALAVYQRLAPIPLARRRQLRVRLEQDGIDITHRANQFSASTRGAGVPGWPHRLRDSAATHLLAAGVQQGDVNLVLGHAPSGELQSYGLPSIRVLRARLARLSLR